MINHNPTQLDPGPDPDRTQRIGNQEVVDMWLPPFPTTDPDRDQRPARPRLWHRLAVALAAVALLALAGCGPRFQDHSDPHSSPLTPRHSAGLAPTHDAGPTTPAPATTAEVSTP